MRRIIFLFVLTIVYLSNQAQQPTTKDSTQVVLPDTVVLKIPAARLQTFMDVWRGGDFYHKEYLFLTELFQSQINRQITIKKQPAKK